MGELKIKDKQIVVPGEVLAEGMDYLPSAGTYRNENDILSNQIGLASVSGRVIKVIPLTGKYKPKRNDIVIGEVVNILMIGWIVDIGGPYSAMLTLKDASSSKVPRIIGREGSMITMIKDSTKCRITVGQNGKVWISGNNVQDETKAVEAIMMVENESHSEGLTDKVKAFLEGK